MNDDKIEQNFNAQSHGVDEDAAQQSGIEPETIVNPVYKLRTPDGQAVDMQVAHEKHVQHLIDHNQQAPMEEPQTMNGAFEQATDAGAHQKFQNIAAEKQAIIDRQIQQANERYGDGYDQLSPIEKLERTQEIEAQDKSHDHDNGIER